MMEGIKFSRQICDEDPDYMVIVIRTPRIAGADIYACDCEGEAAQVKITKFILSSAVGMLHALGAHSLGHAVASVGQLFEKSRNEERPAVH